MGHVLGATAPESLTAILGSCIGLLLYHPRTQMGWYAHVVLPCAEGRSGPPGKFADTAVKHMITLANEAGISSSLLVAKVMGGSRMFGGKGPIQIGENNAAAIKRHLAKEGISVIGEDLGGTKGRRTTVDLSTGNVLIEVIGQEPYIV